MDTIENDYNNPADIDDFIDRFGGWTEQYTFYGGTEVLRYDPKNHEYLLVTPDGLEPLPGVSTVSHIIDKSMVLLPWGCKMMAQKIMATVPTIDGTTVLLSLDQLGKIVNDCKSAHKERLEDAGNVGSVAHAWIETYIKSVLEGDEASTQLIINNTPEEIRAKSACIASLDWQVLHNVRWISTERKIYSRKYKYAGTMDGLCLTDSCDDENCCKTKYKDHLTIVDWKTSNYLYNEFLLQTAAYTVAYEEEMGEKIEDRWVVRLGKDDAAFDAWHLGPETIEDDWEAFHAALVLTRAMQIVDERMVNQKEEHRVWKQKKKAAEKAEINKIACPKSSKFKGTKYPKCNGGEPCQTCLSKYKEVQAQKLAAIPIKELDTESE